MFRSFCIGVCAAVRHVERRPDNIFHLYLRILNSSIVIKQNSLCGACIFHLARQCKTILISKFVLVTLSLNQSTINYFDLNNICMRLFHLSCWLDFVLRYNIHLTLHLPSSLYEIVIKTNQICRFCENYILFKNENSKN